MAVVKADRERCQGYANCVVDAADVFDIDDVGLVMLHTKTVPESERVRVERAARSCPVSALTVEEQ